LQGAAAVDGDCRDVADRCNADDLGVCTVAAHAAACGWWRRVSPAEIGLLLVGLGVMTKAIKQARRSTAAPPLPSPPAAGAVHVLSAPLTFPESIPERDAFILQAVGRGEAEVRYAPLRNRVGVHEAEFRVFADALKVAGVRVNLTAAGQQRVADALGCMLLTVKLADLIWAQRQAELPPHPMSQTPHDIARMSTVERMVAHSEWIDGALAHLPTPAEGIVCTVGKHWVIDDDLAKRPGMAMNYGWHNKTAGPACATSAAGSGCHVIQDPGTAHNTRHTDYSQTCVLVSRACSVDGAPMDLAALLQDRTLAPLASRSGPMRVLRQPGV
jgi:hypothetical protein